MSGLLNMFNSEQGRMGLGLLGGGFGQQVRQGVASMDDFRKQQMIAEIQKLQMQKAQAEMADVQEQKAKAQKMQELYAQFATPGQQAVPAIQGDAESGILPSQGTPSKPAGYDYQGLAGALAKINPLAALELQQKLAKQGPKFSTAPQYDQSGRAFILAEDGSMKYLDGVKARDKLEEVRLGNKVGFRSPYSADMVGSLPIGQSPDSAAQVAATLRGQTLNDVRARDLNAIAQDANNIKRGEKQAEKDLTKSAQVSSFDVMLGSLDRLSKHPGLSRSVGVIGAFPTMPGSESANFKAELDTFQSQAFLPMVSQLKGMGALSDAEGKKLTAAVGALSPTMGEKAFRESVARITADMETARQRLAGKPSEKQPAGQIPMRGQVVDGYKFKGGNPADPNSWERQ